LKKIAVAYSGGLDTSVMVKWLKNKYDCEIITVTGNLGQVGELEGLEEKAKATGASKVYNVDLREEFIKEYAYSALKAGALYEGKYALATAIGRPLLAKLLVDVALKEGCDTIAHGCTGKGNDQVRFELSIAALAPHLDVIAPLRTWEFKSREEEITFAIENNIPVTVTRDRPYSIDGNLWGIATECGILEEETLAAPEDAFQITKNPIDAVDLPQVIEIEFESGIPKSINGVEYDPVELVEYLNIVGSKHGIGRLDQIENRLVGIKSREIYEAPAATVLHQAHYELEKLVIDRETFRYKQNISNKIANMIYDGQWITPLFKSLMAFVNETQVNVTGSVKLQLYKGNVWVTSRSSRYSLYSKELATYTIEDTFNHKDSEGFIKIYSLPYRTLAMKKMELANALGRTISTGT